MFLPQYRVLDLTDETGAFAGKLLGDLGAEVIKVEPPGGDPARWRPPFFRGQRTPESSLDFLAFNTNKRSLTLDLRHAKGRACFVDLVRRSDALIESFAPGTLDGLDLGYSTLREVNRRLVVASITPYGQAGPHRHHLSCDLVAMATSGFMQITGDPDGPPTRLGNEQSRFAPALYAALGVVAALLHRDWHGGPGQHVDVSMQEALLSFYLEQHPVLFWDKRKKNVTRVGPVSNLSVPAGVYPCGDGWIGIGIFQPGEWDTLARWLHEATGREEILAEELRGNIHARAAHRDLIEAILLEFTIKHTRAELFQEGQRRNLVVVPVNTVADLLGDPALAEANFWQELDHPVAGRLRYPLNVLGAEVAAAGRAAPLLGEANEEILCGVLGLPQSELEALRAEGVVAPSRAPELEPLNIPALDPPAPYLAVHERYIAAAALDSRQQTPSPRSGRSETVSLSEARSGEIPLLDGVRIIEFGPFIALPLTGRILAALGATVIKVETNRLPDQLYFIPPWGMGMGQPEYQAMKRRITLDVRRPEGAAVLKRLIGASDVFMTNFRRDALARWGIDLDELRDRHPGLTIVHQTGFGAGPYETYKLYGIMAQHVCGVSTLSGEPGAPPCCLNSAYSDYHTPLFQALAVLGALGRRRTSGRGTFIEGSIFRSGACTMATALLECQAAGQPPERRGNHDLVAVPHNVYPCQGEDEWCAIAVFDDTQWQALCRALGHAEWATDARFATRAARRANERELDGLIAAVTSAWDKHALTDALQGAGVPAGFVAKGRDLSADPQLRSRALYAPTTYYVPDPKKPGIEWQRGPDVLAARLPLLLSETPCGRGPYRRIGEDNDYVYGELLGMAPDEIRRLSERGVFL